MNRTDDLSGMRESQRTRFASKSSWPLTLAAPVIGITQPDSAVTLLSRAAPALVLMQLLIGLALIAGFITTVARSFAVDRPDMLFLVLLALGVGLSLVTAWLNVPLVQRRESIAVAFWHGIVVLTSGVGLLILLFVICTGILVRAMTGPLSTPMPVFMSLITMGCCGLLFVTWLARAAKVLSDQQAAPQLPPRCEDCGYDLTHRPADGRCPECGMLIDLSLGPTSLRRGVAWAENPSTDTWMLSTMEALFDPRRFYRRLQLRLASATAADPLRLANRFSRLHYLGLAAGSMLGALVALAIVFGRERPNFMFEITTCFCLLSATASTCVAWIGHRAMSASWATWWIVSRTLADGRWTAIVHAYESVFLWCAFAPLWALAFSFALAGDWISRNIGYFWGWRTFGAPAEAVAVFTIMGGFALAWCWRYARIASWIRYSNH